MAQFTKTETKEAQAYLLEILQPGATIYTDLRHVAASGTTRWIDLYCVEDGRIRNITWLACKAGALSWCSRRNAIKMAGCGMDMGFAAVYDIGCSLWPTGTPEPHGTRNGEPDSNGGYALRHQWL